MSTLLRLAFSTLGQRVIGGAVTGGAVALQHHFGITLDPATQTSATLMVYGVTHALLDRYAPETAK